MKTLALSVAILVLSSAAPALAEQKHTPFKMNFHKLDQWRRHNRGNTCGCGTPQGAPAPLAAGVPLLLAGGLFIRRKMKRAAAA